MNWTIKNILYINGWLLTFLPFALGGRINETSACLGLTAAASSYLQNTFGTNPILTWGNYYGGDLKICAPRSTNPSVSCCTKQHEEIFLENAFTLIPRYSPKTLSDIIRTQSTKMSEQIQSLLDKTMEKVHFRLSTYRIPAWRYYPALTALFNKLAVSVLPSSTPLTPKSIIEGQTQEYIETFFIELFPSVFLHHLSGTSEVNSNLQECLKNKYDTFQPRPFLNLPAKYGRQLHTVLSAYHSLLEALQVAAELVNTTITSPPSTACLHGLIRLRLCHLCSGQNVSRPCSGVCLNVHRGCFAHLLPLRLGWKKFVKTTRRLVDIITARHDLIKNLESFDSTILRAIQNALHGVITYGRQALNRCMHAADLGNKPENASDPSGSSDRIKPPRNVKISDPELEPRLNVIRSLLINHQLFYHTLPDQYCKGLRTFDCWNGTHQSPTGYSRRVLKFSNDAQPVNPEVQMEAPDSFPNAEVKKQNNLLLVYSERLHNFMNAKLAGNLTRPTDRSPWAILYKNKNRANKAINENSEGSGGSVITGLPKLPIDDDDSRDKSTLPSDSEMSGSGKYEYPPEDGRPYRRVSTTRETSNAPQNEEKSVSDGDNGSTSVKPHHGLITTVGVLICVTSRLLVT